MKIADFVNANVTAKRWPSDIREVRGLIYRNSSFRTACVVKVGKRTTLINVDEFNRWVEKQKE